ncbi:MAG: GNAT family N-acetyltransferase [Paludibacteraceae bacterium]
MINYFHYTPINTPNANKKEAIIDFLYTNLENYGDPKEDIGKCIEYALKETNSFGGFILTAEEDNRIVGCLVINETGMKDYIPENILVYVATRKDFRGLGIGRTLIAQVIEKTNGNIALHVDPDNPAIKLYEKVGFTTKYHEMRLIKNR